MDSFRKLVWLGSCLLNAVQLVLNTKKKKITLSTTLAAGHYYLQHALYGEGGIEEMKKVHT